MNNQEAINCLNADFDCHACKYHKTDKCHEKEAYDMAISALEKQINGGWIKCSDRLPKHGEVVLCTCRNGGITVSCITYKGAKTAKWVSFGQHYVAAWKPLPEPYKESDES